MAKGLAIESVEQSMTSAVSGSSATVCLSAFAIFERLPAKSTLVDFSLLCPRERNTEMFKLVGNDLVRSRLNEWHELDIPR